MPEKSGNIQSNKSKFGSNFFNSFKPSFPFKDEEQSNLLFLNYVALIELLKLHLQ